MNRLLKAINYDGDFYYDILSLSFQENELKEILKANDMLKILYPITKKIKLEIKR
jgi:asparagine synthase (glutamine-hydrolysing)